MTIKSYADIRGLKMYFEIHGKGRPLVLLHGGMGSLQGSFETIFPTLSRHYKVIAMDQQGHGRTADNGRPMAYEEQVEDTAALLKFLKIPKADFFGWSDGGVVALGLAIKYPRLVGKLSFSGSHPAPLKGYFSRQMLAGYKKTKGADMPPQMSRLYRKISPTPKDWDEFVARVLKMSLIFKGFPAAKVKKIKAPTLIFSGDKDVVLLEKTIELYQNLSNARLSIIPDAGHSWILEHRDIFLKQLQDFLNAPDERREGGWV